MTQTKNYLLLAFFLLSLIFFLYSFAFAGDTLINVNTATRIELMELKGIGKVKSKRIIAGRPFASIDSLINVKGIGLKTLVKIYPFVTIQDSIETHIHQEGE